MHLSLQKFLRLQFCVMLFGLTSVEKILCQDSLLIAEEHEKLKSLFAGARGFEDIFEFKRHVEFKSVDIIGQIWQLDINTKGDFLVVDDFAKKIWLFNHSGELLNELETEKDYPGVKWLPLGAWFTQDDKILVQLDRNNNLFLFDQNGNFIKPIQVFFPPQYNDFAISEDGFIYAYGTGGKETTIRKIDFSGRVLNEGGIFPQKYQEFIKRSLYGGVEIDSDHFIYQFNVSGPEIYKFDSELKHIKTFDRKPDFYKKMARDYPTNAGNPAQFMSMVYKLRKDVTTTYSLDIYRGSFLFVQYIMVGRNGVYLDICDLDGTYSTNHEIRYSNPIKAVSDQFIYQVHQPEVTDQDEVLNPVLVEYQIKADW